MHTGHRVEVWFPKLTASGYTITSREDWTYNCFAFAAGDREHWWDPEERGPTPSMRGFWFEDLPRDITVPNFIAAYAKFGFERCTDGLVEEGFEKIAIYADSDGRPTHASRQLPNGRWMSKAGGYEDFAHFLDSLEGNAGEEYGSVVVYLKRNRV